MRQEPARTNAITGNASFTHHPPPPPTTTPPPAAAATARATAAAATTTAAAAATATATPTPALHSKAPHLMHFIMQWQGRGENAELLEFSKNTVPVVSNLPAPGAQGAP